jgi:glycosyltransferase involved in cell wall biosynthesis
VGDAPYAEGYQEWLRSLTNGDPRFVLTGYLFGRGYNELSSNAYAFIETSSVGGTHPAVLEAMAFGNCVIVNNTPENLETIGDSGLQYDGKIGAESLRNVLKQILAQKDLVDACRSKAQLRVASEYSWENVVDAYERVFYELLRLPLPERLALHAP